MAFGLAAAVALLAGCGSGGGSDEPPRASGPVAVLYVTDHLGAEPRPGHLVPYAKAFRRVRQGCRITADALANTVIQLTEQASTGSGTALTNLDTLRALARHVGTTPKDCTETFTLVEARLEGGALG